MSDGLDKVFKTDKVFDVLNFGHVAWKPKLETLPLTSRDGKPLKLIVKPRRGLPQKDTINE